MMLETLSLGLGGKMDFDMKFKRRLEFRKGEMNITRHYG